MAIAVTLIELNAMMDSFKFLLNVAFRFAKVRSSTHFCGAKGDSNPKCQILSKILYFGGLSKYY